MPLENYKIWAVLVMVTVGIILTMSLIALVNEYRIDRESKSTPTNQCMIEQWYCVPITSTGIYKIQIEEK